MQFVKLLFLLALSLAGSCLFGLFLFLLMFGIIDAHAHEFVFECHERMRQEHAETAGLHDGQKFFGLLFAEADAVTAIADGLCNAVGAARYLGHDGHQERLAFGAELIARCIVVFMTIDGEALLDVRFFLRDIVFNLYWLFFR
uniref:Uncharacterized protein n=1 Tax=Myoviridae sp. ctMnh10 TaxID=2827682 RepID=A0A8S5THB9_9CAUD|nr:MAG TPA: hypothetical protein [Myoviridae sp. ctMnh10]